MNLITNEVFKIYRTLVLRKILMRPLNSKKALNYLKLTANKEKLMIMNLKTNRVEHWHYSAHKMTTTIVIHHISF